MPELRLTKDDLITIRHALRHEVERGHGGTDYQREVRSVISKLDAALMLRRADEQVPTPPLLTDVLRDKAVVGREDIDPLLLLGGTA